jgi:hypothetical protein
MRIATLVLALAAVPLVLAAQAPAGVVKPGMTIDQVVAAWGKPLKAVSGGEYTYLYYDSGCVQSCGSNDVVFLERGQVVDAVARGPGHHYEGVSSLAPDRKPAYTPPTH